MSNLSSGNLFTKKSNSKQKHKSLPPRDNSKLKNILANNLKRASNARVSNQRKTGIEKGSKDGEQGIPVPQALSGGSKVNSSNRNLSTRNVRNRAGSGVSVSSEKREESVLHDGYVKKKGVVNTSWKSRYFVLTNRHIYYYEMKPEDIETISLETTAKGKIPLDVIQAIEKDKGKKKEPTKFNIITATRIYRLQSFNDEGDTKKAVRDADGWIGSIAGAIENFKQMNYKQRRRESGSSLEWIKEHEKAVQDSINISMVPPSSQAISGPNEPARLSNWLNWSSFDVAAWLYKVDLSKVYSEMFYEKKIDGKKLSEITKDDLNEIGVDNEEDQMKILNAVEELRTMTI